MIASNRLTFLAILVAIVTSGCAANVKFDYPSIPDPLIDKLPMNIALRLPDEFYDFSHEENVLGKETWSIHLGASCRCSG